MLLLNLICKITFQGKFSSKNLLKNIYYTSGGLLIFLKKKTCGLAKQSQGFKPLANIKSRLMTRPKTSGYIRFLALVSRNNPHWYS